MTQLSNEDPEFIREARRAANAPEMVRFECMTVEIAKLLLFGQPVNDEVFKTAGYRDANEYWAVAMSEPMKASSFAHLLATHLIDPTEHLSEFDRRTKVQRNLDSALKVAIDAREIIFVEDPKAGDGAGDVILRPREASEWLLRKPKRRDLVPSGLKAFLESNTPPAEKSRRKRLYESTRPAIQHAARELGKQRSEYKTFEEYRRALCQIAHVDKNAHGWGEDSVRRALRTNETAARTES